MPIRNEINQSIIERLRKGDNAAFNAIYASLSKQIYARIFSLLKNRELSEDILQETFISLWLNKEKLTGDQPLVPYVYLTANRLTIDAFRKIATETNFKQTLPFSLSEVSCEMEEVIIAADLLQFTDDVVNLLPLQQQVVFRLSRQEQLSYDEIAVKLKISRNTVRNHLVCALKTLRMVLAKHTTSFLLILFFLT